MLAVIVDWDTPFATVTLKHQRIIDADPGAPFNCCIAHKSKTVPLNFLLAVNCYMLDSLTASEYILDNFKPSDRIAILLRNRATGEVIQRIALVEKIAGRDFQEWLTERNHLRLPGFANRKYGHECVVQVTKHSDKTYNHRDFKLASGLAKGDRNPVQRPPRLGGTRETLTQSERDWAYAKRALARGDDPEEIIRRIADYRADEKYDPEYYARHTVTKAQTEFQGRVATPSSQAAEISHNSREMP